MVDPTEWKPMVVFSNLLSQRSFSQPPPPATTPSPTTSWALVKCPPLLGLWPSCVLVWRWQQEQIGRQNRCRHQISGHGNYSKLTCTHAECSEETVLYQRPTQSKLFLSKIKTLSKLENINRGDLQAGRGVRRGDHLPPHKYIRNTSTCGTTPTEHLLNAGRRCQTFQQSRNSPRTWVV